MVEEKEVSVGWQMFFVLIPLVDLWAFYRIKKFWLGVGVNFIIGFIVGLAVGFGEGLAGVPGEELSIEGTILTYGIASVFVLFIMRKWSIAWNEKVTYQRRVF